jgi:hypothetical protein
MILNKTSQYSRTPSFRHLFGRRLNHLITVCPTLCFPKIQLKIIHNSLSPMCRLLFMGLSPWEGENCSDANEDIHHLL